MKGPVSNLVICCGPYLYQLILMTLTRADILQQLPNLGCNKHISLWVVTAIWAAIMNFFIDNFDQQSHKYYPAIARGTCPRCSGNLSSELTRCSKGIWHKNGMRQWTISAQHTQAKKWRHYYVSFVSSYLSLFGPHETKSSTKSKTISTQQYMTNCKQNIYGMLTTKIDFCQYTIADWQTMIWPLLTNGPQK